MEINEYLLGALENVLGKGQKTSGSNFSFFCPFCNHHKRKLEINLATNERGENFWQCWVCGTKGRTIKSLLRHLGIFGEEAKQVLQFVQNGEEVEVEKKDVSVSLPEEFKQLSSAPLDSYEANRFKQYLYNRGLTDNDFIRYNIGYCTKGQYADRVIIPSYNSSNVLNYFVARSIDPNELRRYMNPTVPKDKIVPLENLINWNQSIIICEGIFDALAIRRNCVPLFGKFVSSALMKKIIENPVPSIYIVLDQDAMKQALEHCETFLDYGKKVYLVKPGDKDPSEEGFVKITEQFQKAKELTFSSLLKYKLGI